MINFFKNICNGTHFTIQSDPWRTEDTEDMKSLVAVPYFKTLKKLVDRRINARTEDLVNGKETRDRIDELKDLLLELQNYENPR